MEQKTKLNDSEAEGRSANGGRSKEVALEKLRKMEWKRNAQDPWHLARSNSRGSAFQERKKYNKDEDNYFEGTGVQKTKKLRRPRVPEGSPSVPPGFSVAQGASAPPPVNAWAQKKGSDLFQREDEIDEEDQVMKLVLEASLKSAEEDKKRRLERLKMTNLDLPASSSQAVGAEKNWEEENKKEDYYEKHSLDDFKGDSIQAELHFIEMDVKEEKPTVNQRHRSIPLRSRKMSPREIATSPSSKENLDISESVIKAPPILNKNICSKEASCRVVCNDPNNADFFEPSSPHANYSKPVDKVKETTSSSNITRNSIILPSSSVEHANINSDDLVTNFNSTLTFGDTQGLFEEIHGDNELQFSENSHYFKNEIPSHLIASDGTAEKRSVNPSEPSETDILLHNFIRHEPPSDISSMAQSSFSDLAAVRQSEPNDFFTQPASPTFSSQHLKSAQGYVHQIGNTEHHPMMNGLVGNTLPGEIQISNGRDSSSSLSGSPLQNITPFGSLENEIPPSVRSGIQVPPQIGSVPYYPYPYIVENKESLSRQLQAIQLMNQNLTSAMNTQYSSIPTPVRGMMPGNPQVGQPQYRLPNSNMTIPSFQGHISPLLLQHQLQQAQLQQVQMPPGYLPQMGLPATQLQQSHLPTRVAESDDNATNEQGNINPSPIQNDNHLLAQNQPQMLSQTPQPQMLSQTPQPQILPQTQAHILAQAQAQILSHTAQMSQNQPQLLHQQNHQQIMSMQHQPQAVPTVETATPKQEELLHQHSLQNSRAQPGGKTKEELHIQYQNILQAMTRICEEMQEAQVPPPIPMAQAQPLWGTAAMPPLAVNQYFPMGMIPQVHPHLIQQPPNTGLMSPSIQSNPQNPPVSRNVSPEINLRSEINMVQEPTQTSIGRGRGRLH